MSLWFPKWKKGKFQPQKLPIDISERMKLKLCIE